MLKIKKGDEIIVTGGKDKGKKGKVDRIINGRVLIPGLNAYKRHMKKKDEKDKGGIVEFFRPLPMGNIALYCSHCKQPTRIGFELKGDDKRRICKKCKQGI